MQSLGHTVQTILETVQSLGLHTQWKLYLNHAVFRTVDTLTEPCSLWDPHAVETLLEQCSVWDTHLKRYLNNAVCGTHAVETVLEQCSVWDTRI